MSVLDADQAPFVSGQCNVGSDVIASNSGGGEGVVLSTVTPRATGAAVISFGASNASTAPPIP